MQHQMNKIQTNIAQIEQKFMSLKAAYQLNQQSTPIGQVVEVMTSGIISQAQVENYLKHAHTSSQIQPKQKIIDKWYHLDFQQMIKFVDELIQHKNINQSQSSPNNQQPTLSPKKKKLKQPISQVHQNPFIPHDPAGTLRKSMQNPNDLTQKNLNQNLQNQNITIQQKQIGQRHQPIEGSKQEKQSTLPQLNINPEKSSQNKHSKSPSKSKQIFIDLGADFEDLPVKSKYSILSKKYAKDKGILDRRFDHIYKHYRKQMYIPFESFQINNELLMDMRLFLKYYRQFQLSKTFKTNQAIKHFKKTALNGLWLDQEKFIEIHHKLVQLLDLSKTIFDECLQTVHYSQTQTANPLKNQLHQNIHNLTQNIAKIHQLSQIVSEQKVKSLSNLNNDSKNFVKKIVQVHSGLIKDDVIFKLQQMTAERKFKKNLLLVNFNLQKPTHLSPEKMNSYQNKLLEDPILRLSPQKVSIYEELQIPKLRSRQMRNSSIYSSLQILNIEKQKEKLRQLVNQKDNQKYLQAFFKKQKQMFTQQKRNSVNIQRSSTQTKESRNSISVYSNGMNNNFNRGNLFQRNFSLPRMKFT